MSAENPFLLTAVRQHPLVKRFLAASDSAARGVGYHAARYDQRAHSLLQSAQNRADLEEAASLFGMLNRHSIVNGYAEGIHSSFNGLAYAMRWFPSPDPDVTLELAASILEHSAVVLEKLGELRLAAIARTNRSILFLEKRYPNENDLARAQYDIDFGFKYKERGTLDWSYNLHAQALLEFKRPYDTASVVPRLLDAKKLFRKSQRAVWDDLSDDQRLTASSQVAFAEVRILKQLREDGARRSITTHARTLPAHLHETALKTPSMLSGLLTSNPEILGLSEVPSWFGKDVRSEQAIQSRRGEAKRCRNDLQAALRDNPTRNVHAREFGQHILALLNWELEPSIETYEARRRSLGVASITHFPADYFRNGSQLLNDGYRELRVEPSRDFLLNLADAYTRVMEEREQSRLESFIEQNPYQIRFVACSMAEIGEWKESFELLERTRGVLSTPSLTANSHPCSAHAIHVTHSPKSTYVIIRLLDGSYNGRSLPDLAGPVITRLWRNVIENAPELVVTSPHSRPSRSAALETAAVDLSKIVNAVQQLVPNDAPIVLCPGGLYTHFPLPALISCSDTAGVPPPTVLCNVTANHVSRESVERVESASLVTLDASYASGSPLPFAAEEIRAVARSLPSARTRLRAATIDNCLSAFRSKGIVHYAGHSSASSTDPRQSALVLHDGALSAGLVMESGPLRADLVVLSSCESGLATSATWSDEYLSVQTALLLGGCTRSIGTLWRVADVSAGVFFSHFYQLLSSLGEVSTRSISRAMVSSQQWLRRATTGEIRALLGAVGINENLLPDHPIFQDLDASPFVRIVHWGPYYLTSNSV